MSNEEFDNLKEELMWEGSSVVMLCMSYIPSECDQSFSFSCISIRIDEL